MVVMLLSSSMRVSRPRDTLPRLKNFQIQTQLIMLNSSKFLLKLEKVSKLDSRINGLRSLKDYVVFLRKQLLVFIDLTKCQLEENL